MQHIFHFQELFTLAFHHFGHRNAGDARHDFGHFVGTHFGAEKLVGLLGFGVALCRLQLRAQLGQFAVFQLGCTAEIALALGLLDFHFNIVDLFFDVGGAGRRRFFGFPDFIQIGVFFLQAADFFVDQHQAFFARLVAFFFNVHFFHAQLDDAPVELIHLLGLAVELHFDAAGRFVNQINRFIG